MPDRIRSGAEKPIAAERTVVVTGGSRGLGLAIAGKLTGSGYRVVVVARKMSPQLAAAMQEVNGTRAGALDFVACDLGDAKAIPKLVRGIRQKYSSIYGLVNNAALGTDGLLANMKNSEIEQLLRVNTLAPVMLSKYVVRGMMADGGGRIVNVTSIIGFTGYSGLSVYGATKASMIGFTRSLAREVGRLGINVNAVAPGFLETEMTRSLSDEQRQSVARRSAMRRLVELDDVADAVEFLLSDKAKSITGTVLTVDAGSTA
ncbi:MAG TPA: SDR family oxidoreductase [Xanthobacteraceae bacterium]|jgi:3-oxoacyl-[acyl-carrier protein] reductase|nr:SDR family oxidoreductase [Xanthobacteraceae bacterium]